MTRHRRKGKSNQSESLTTADHLARAVHDNVLPQDPKTCEDYGFNRAITYGEQCNLLGLYNGTICNLVKAVLLDAHTRPHQNYEGATQNHP